MPAMAFGHAPHSDMGLCACLKADKLQDDMFYGACFICYDRARNACNVLWQHPASQAHATPSPHNFAQNLVEEDLGSLAAQQGLECEAGARKAPRQHVVAVGIGVHCPRQRICHAVSGRQRPTAERLDQCDVGLRPSRPEVQLLNSRLKAAARCRR